MCIIMISVFDMYKISLLYRCMYIIIKMRPLKIMGKLYE